MKYRVTHITTYTGKEPVSVGHNEARLKPRECPGQQCVRHKLKITPRPSIQSDEIDYFGNPLTLFGFSQGYDELQVTSEIDIVVEPRAVLPPTSPSWNQVAQALRTHKTPETLAAYEFVFPSPQSDFFDELKAYAEESFLQDRPILEALKDLTSRIHADFQYDPRATTVTTAVPEVFDLRRGVCQDFAHLEIAALRSLGLAARYVSGYLRTDPPPGKPRLIGADASHAWLSVFCGPKVGWVDVDPTNDKFSSTDHITIAWGRDYGDVTPLKGVFVGGGTHMLSVSVDVVAAQ